MEENMLEPVEFRPARSRNARARIFKSPEVVARELSLFATEAGFPAFTNVGKFLMLVQPGENPNSVVSRHQRQVRRLHNWNRRCGSDRRQFMRIDEIERRKP